VLTALRDIAGETIAFISMAPKEQPPRKLTGKRTVKVDVKIWREVAHGMIVSDPPKGMAEYAAKALR
jgi:GDP-D-mannose dehydratase